MQEKVEARAAQHQSDHWWENNSESNFQMERDLQLAQNYPLMNYLHLRDALWDSEEEGSSGQSASTPVTLRSREPKHHSQGSESHNAQAKHCAWIWKRDIGNGGREPLEIEFNRSTMVHAANNNIPLMLYSISHTRGLPLCQLASSLNRQRTGWATEDLFLDGHCKSTFTQHGTSIPNSRWARQWRRCSPSSISMGGGGSTKMHPADLWSNRNNA